MSWRIDVPADVSATPRWAVRLAHELLGRRLYLGHNAEEARAVFAADADTWETADAAVRAALAEGLDHFVAEPAPGAPETPAPALSGRVCPVCGAQGFPAASGVTALGHTYSGCDFCTGRA